MKHAFTIKHTAERYIGKAATNGAIEVETDTSAIPANTLPLRDQIEALRLCITNTTPILSLLRQLDELENTRKKYVAFTDRLVRIEKAANGIESFSGIENLVFQQVSGLIGALQTEARRYSGPNEAPESNPTRWACA